MVSVAPYKSVALPLEQLCRLLKVDNIPALLEVISKNDWQKIVHGKKSDQIYKLHLDETAIVYGKISFYIDDDKVKIRIHPKRDYLENSLHLSEKELQLLKSGRCINVICDEIKQIVQLDTDINEFMTANYRSVVLPSKIGEIELENSEKNSLKAGHVINQNGIQIKLNLNNVNFLEISKHEK